MPRRSLVRAIVGTLLDVGIGKIKHSILKLYAIPTTSGTGSEATIGAVISDAQTHEKAIIMGDCLLPLAAALDADLMLGLPPHITAATGMDALTHAIESYIGRVGAWHTVRGCAPGDQVGF